MRYVGDHVALVVAETLEQAKDAAELIDVDYDVLPAVVDPVGGAQSRRAARSTTTRPTTSATLGARRQGGGRRGVRQGRARHQARHRQQPADPERDRAARRGRELQPRRRQLHALRHQPEPARRAAADDRVRARLARDQGARDRARRRRRLRLEDLSLPRRDRAGLGVEAASTARSSGPPSAASRSSPTRTAATT